MIKRDNFPLLLKRSHFLNDIGISNSMYYKLLHSNSLPVTHMDGNYYVLRDAYFDMLEKNAIQLLEEI